MKRFWIAGTALFGIAAASVAAAPGGGTPVAAVSPGKTPTVSGSLTPAPYEKEVAGIVGDMLQSYHYEKHPIDDEISARWLGNYLDMLDWSRMVFLQSDIDEFAKYKTTLDDDLRQKEPRLDPALLIYERYRQRMRERTKFTMSLLDTPVDLTNAERFVPDRHEAKLPWPTTAAEANDLWRQRTEEEVIDDLLTGRDTEPEIRTRLHKRYERVVRGLEDTESTDVLELWLTALAGSYDPHSTWFKPASKDDFDISITNSVQGIGAQLKEEDDFTIIAEIVAGGPAFKNQKLKKDDRILMVGQERQEPVDVVGMRLENVVKLIRGPKDTEVTLHIEHADGAREVVELTRDQVMLEESASEAHVEQVGDHKLGVVDLPTFYMDPNGKKAGRRASEDMRRQLKDLSSQGVQGVVLDLRGNGGGSLVEAIDVAGLFLPAGPVVQVRDRDGRIEALNDADPSVAWSGPMIVLTDATSASASEIVAGALQDYGRAVIVGDRSTHGKGTVQQIAPLTPQLRDADRYTEEVGGALKITVQKFYRVSGGSTQNKGVEADVVFPSPWDGLDVHESDSEYALAWDQIPPAAHVRTGDPRTVIPQLRTRSDARRAASDDYSKLEKVLDEREKLQAEPSVSLVLTERKQEYADRKARAGIEDTPDDDAQLSPEEMKRKAREADYELDEALAVLNDLIELS